MRVVVVFTLTICLVWGVSGGGSSGGNAPLRPAEKILAAPRVRPPILVAPIKLPKSTPRKPFLGMKFQLPIKQTVEHLKEEFK